MSSTSSSTSDSSGRARSCSRRAALREQLLALPELSDVDELVDDIEIDIPPLARSEIVRRDDQVAVLVAHAHVPPLGGEELHPQALEGRLRLRAENGSDGRQVLEALEMIEEPIVPQPDVFRNLDIRK